MTESAASQQANARSEAVYTVSVAATLSGMHAQTLRQYDRLGLVTPGRTKGQGRRYSSADIERLRHIQRLTQEHGVNLAGVQRILELEEEMRSLKSVLDDLNAALARAQAPVKGVFTADSEGKVQLRSHSGAVGRRSDVPTSGGDVAAASLQLPGSRPVGAARELVELVSSKPGRHAPVELSMRPGSALAERGLTGWQLVASLRLGQIAERRKLV